MFAGIMPPLRF